MEGAVLIAEAIAGGFHVVTQFVSGDAYPVMGSDAEVFQLGAGVLERVASTEAPQPNLAIVERRSASLGRLLTPDAARSAGEPWVVYLDSVTDPGNLGTILRTAEAMGAAGVVLSPGCVDAFNPKVVRSSAGALFHVPVIEAVTLAELRDAGFALVGTSSHEQPGAMEVRAADLSGRIAVVMGNEKHGVAAEHASAIERWVYIEHRGRAESLNVAMATAIVCFALAGQRAKQ